jgi:tetratricopeptide (TPR) repeat protein
MRLPWTSDHRKKHRRRRKSLLRKAWFWVLLAVILLVGGFKIFTVWRARDLAGKATESFERGDYRMAWLQLRSARELQPGDTEVLRVGAMLESKFGHSSALATLQELERKGSLQKEDVSEKARMAMRFGSEQEFEEALQKLEAMGGQDDSVTLRTARAAMRGDIDRAIKEARQALKSSDNPEAKLELARLLGKRHGHTLRTYGRPAAEDVPALREIVQIIDSLQSSKLAEPALALGLGAVAADEQTRKKWAEAAMRNVDPSNPALLPAAEFLVRSGASTAPEMQAKLRPLYDTAPLAQRADFALWLSRQGIPKEGLTLITAQEAEDDLSAFLARTDALARMSNWQGVLETTEKAEQVPESMRRLTRVWALANSKDGLAMGPALVQAVEAAVQAAARERQLRPMLESLDSIGAGPVADAELAKLCTNPEAADVAFSLLRERIGRTGGTAALQTSYERALLAAPNAPSVADHGRYLELFRTSRIDPADTAAAIASKPAEVSPRATHALLMLRRNDPSGAKATFDDITVFYDRMNPAHQVIVAAYTAGTGKADLAQKMRRAINTKILTSGELALLNQWVPEKTDQE